MSSGSPTTSYGAKEGATCRQRRKGIRSHPCRCCPTSAASSWCLIACDHGREPRLPQAECCSSEVVSLPLRTSQSPFLATHGLSKPPAQSFTIQRCAHEAHCRPCSPLRLLLRRRRRPPGYYSVDPCFRLASIGDLVVL